SVTIPLSSSSSITGSTPVSSSRIISAISASVLSGVAFTISVVIMFRIFMAFSPNEWSEIQKPPPRRLPYFVSQLRDVRQTNLGQAQLFSQERQVLRTGVLP